MSAPVPSIIITSEMDLTNAAVQVISSTPALFEFTIKQSYSEVLVPDKNFKIFMDCIN